jgi:hypothetical protein
MAYLAHVFVPHLCSSVTLCAAAVQHIPPLWLQQCTFGSCPLPLLVPPLPPPPPLLLLLRWRLRRLSCDRASCSKQAAAMLLRCPTWAVLQRAIHPRKRATERPLPQQVSSKLCG